MRSIYGANMNLSLWHNDWENLTKAAIETASLINVEIGQFETIKTVDIRPKVYDQKSCQWILLDTGAATSVFPQNQFPTAKQDEKRVLRAVNGSKIATYGTKQVQLIIDNKTYLHDCLLYTSPSPRD